MLPTEVTRLDSIPAKEMSEDARWRAWKMKGRNDEARFRERLKNGIVDLAAVVALAGALWLAFGV